MPRPGFVRFKATVKNGQNVARRAEDAAAGDVLLAAGCALGPAEIGVLAFAGCDPVPVRRKPRVAILGTGDELVEPAQTPGPSQIRNSNSHQLLAQCAARHLSTEYLGIAPDDPARTREMAARLCSTRASVALGTGSHSSSSAGVISGRTALMRKSSMRVVSWVDSGVAE